MKNSNNILIPDKWQQEAIQLLKMGKDVVLHAPTGAGKTFIFEWLVENRILKGKAIFTVPTRALANDKLYEWQKRNWNVGLCTGDVSVNLEAPVLVATLETQKRNLLEGRGPNLLVIDEYQMLNDSNRGLNYELAIAAAPRTTQLLLMSGSVGNPKDIQGWLQKNGRDAGIVLHHERPVPQEEVQLEALKGSVPKNVRNYWVKSLIKALKNDLGPILVFAPKRHVSEQLAKELEEALNPSVPLVLKPEHKKMARHGLSSMLKKRVAYHHSGLNYLQRARLIEPLAKKGELQVVVATTGLGAGINFSMRSVLIIDREYRQGEYHHNLRPDELLQMFGRAGRRGFDDKGYILTSPGKPSLREGRPIKLIGQNQIDWPSFIHLLQRAKESHLDPVQSLRDLIHKLYSDQMKPIGLGAFLKLNRAEKLALQPKQILKKSNLSSNNEVLEILNSNGVWERKKGPTQTTAGSAFIYHEDKYIPALQIPKILKDLRIGNLCKFKNNKVQLYGREIPLAKFPEESNEDSIFLTKWFYQNLKKQKLLPRNKTIVGKKCPFKIFETKLIPKIPQLTHGAKVKMLHEKGNLIYARLDFSDSPVFGVRDETGKVLINPPQRTRENHGMNFQQLLGDSQPQKEPKSTAEKWFAFGLIDEDGFPTRTGLIFSFFNHGEGLAIAAALSDETYPIRDLIWDLANMRAGYRFTENSGSSDRLANNCREKYGHCNIESYLKKGLPLEYGEGAAEIIHAAAENQGNLLNFVNHELKLGDIERGHIEWKNLLNTIVQAPHYEWDRWIELKKQAQKKTFQSNH
ncbi:MAG: DEAD/DEAH box helicase [Opitutae bacterium]|nr:DEAD/DEAH box helicase [Opitutae bacterium]